MEEIKVVIVEDNTEISNSLKILINGSSGLSCKYVFSDAESAEKELPLIKPDVVLMDIHLPGKSGIECIKILKSKLPETQFMICTIYEDDENIFEALKAGASGYLLKRTSSARLIEAMMELHAGGAPMSTEIARRVVETIHNKTKPAPASAVLTPRELEIVDYLSKGYMYKEIASEFSISIETVKKHIRNIYGKLQVQSRTDAVNKVFQK